MVAEITNDFSWLAKLPEIRSRVANLSIEERIRRIEGFIEHLCKNDLLSKSVLELHAGRLENLEVKESDGC